MLSSLEGYRTYLLCSLALLVCVANYFGVVSDDMQQKLVEILGFGSLVTLRIALKNLPLV